MLCIEQIGKLIKDEIKFNVKVRAINVEWLRDKEVIALDSNFKLFEIYPYGYTDLTQLRRSKEINYLVIMHKSGMYLADVREAHQVPVYRSRQTGIWNHFKDINKLGEDWWQEHLTHYVKKHGRYKKHLGTAEKYLVDLERWLALGEGTNYFTADIKEEFISRIDAVKAVISNLKEQADETGCDVSESIDSIA